MVRVAIGTPQPPTTPPDVVVDPTQRVEVSTKSTWDGEWVPQPNIDPLEAVWAAPPSLSTATFRHEFGERLLVQGTAFETVRPLSLRDHYIKVAVFTSDDATVPIHTWVGQIVDDTRDVHGRNADASRGDKAGTQHLTAYGLEHILRKCPIDKTWCWENNTLKGVRSPMAFNQTFPGGPLSGNASVEPGVLTFTSSLGVVQANEWSYATIIAYLLKYFVNTRTTPQVEIASALAVAGGFGLVDIVRIEHLFGLTVWDALNKMLDRRRGFGWNLRTTGDGVVDLDVWTILSEPITIGDVTIPANPNQVTKELDETILIPDGGLLIGDNANRQYSTVVVLGAPIISTFTVSYIDETLVEGWTETEETAYKDAASETEGYGNLSLHQKKAINDKMRVENDALRRVYMRHRIPDDFGWVVGTSEGLTSGTYQVVPSCDAIGNVNIDPGTPPDQVNRLKRLLPFLPLSAGLDYSTSPPTVVDGDGPSEFMSPIIQLAIRNFLHRSVDTMGGVDDNLPAVNIKIWDQGMGFDLVRADANHMSHDWAWTNPYYSQHSKIWDMAEVEPTLWAPAPGTSADYRSLVATVAAETDERPRVVVNAARWTPDNDTTLILEFPDIQFWHAATDTIVGLDAAGKPLRVHAENRILRDDTRQLQAIAALVQDWYSTLRRTIRLTWRTYDYFEVGTLLLAVSSSAGVRQFNTVITRVAWNFGAVTTTISSEFVDLDFARMFGGTSHVR